MHQAVARIFLAHRFHESRHMRRPGPNLSPRAQGRGKYSRGAASLRPLRASGRAIAYGRGTAAASLPSPRSCGGEVDSSGARISGVGGLSCTGSLAIDPIVPRIETKLSRAMPACRWVAIHNRRRPPTPTVRASLERTPRSSFARSDHRKSGWEGRREATRFKCDSPAASGAR
jgi:hypothetical protein